MSRSCRLLLFLMILTAQPGAAQSGALGLELRAYPAGVIPSARGDWSVGPRLTFTASAGYNLTDRRDWGEHDDESGSGPGLGVSVTRRLGQNEAGWFLGFRAEFWTLGIDWRDPGARTGSTRVSVFQPTARVGRVWGGERSRLRVEAAASLGAELNVRTRGEEVGQGPILLLGVALLGII